MRCGGRNLPSWTLLAPGQLHNWSSWTSKTTQERATSSQERPKTESRTPKTESRSPKSYPKSPKSHPRSPKSGPRAPKTTPRDPQDHCKRFQERPKTKKIACPLKPEACFHRIKFVPPKLPTPSRSAHETPHVAKKSSPNTPHENAKSPHEPSRHRTRISRTTKERAESSHEPPRQQNLDPKDYQGARQEPP